MNVAEETYSVPVERPLCLQWPAKRSQSKQCEARFDSRKSSRGAGTGPGGPGANGSRMERGVNRKVLVHSFIQINLQLDTEHILFDDNIQFIAAGV
jgi:hypothetical protein